MNRCENCCMPDTRPDTPFVDGVCAGCLNYAKRPDVDWDERKRQLIALLERHNGRCIVPSSGGKDSHYQVLQLLELGARPIVVTASTCMLTKIGRQNIDNLGRYADTIEVTPNRAVRAKLNRIGLERVGDISWPEHVAIFTVPFHFAKRLGIPLMFYGENPQDQYGGPHGSEEAQTMTERWRSEFGGFLGLRPDDMVGQYGIVPEDMLPYQMTALSYAPDTEAHFLGAYIPWDSHRNADMAYKAGMRSEMPSPANWWPFENLDNAMTGLHDHLMYRKYGYGRLCAQISVDVRAGKISLEVAMPIVEERDGRFPYTYMGVGYQEVLAQIGMNEGDFWNILDRFTNRDIFQAGGMDPAWPRLK